MKKLISTALCAVLATGSAICAGAAEPKPHEGVKILSQTLITRDNAVNVFAYNISPDSKSGIIFRGVDTGRKYEINFADCIGMGRFVNISTDDNYTRSIKTTYTESGNLYSAYSFANNGGEYVKVKIKLSAVAPSYFNSDGSYTIRNHNYNFKYEKVSDGYYDSALCFYSGGVFTGATPDNDGCVEFYMSTKIRERVDFCIALDSNTSVGGGTNSGMLPCIIFGDINLDNGVNINDATALQRYFSGDNTDFDTLQYFYADINRDGKRDICDVTALQNGIAE